MAHLQQEREAWQHELGQLVWRWALQDAAEHEGRRLSVPPVLWPRVPVDVWLQERDNIRRQAQQC